MFGKAKTPLPQREPFTLLLHCNGANGAGCKDQPAAMVSVGSVALASADLLGVALMEVRWLLVKGDSETLNAFWVTLCPLCGLQFVAQMLERAKAAPDEETRGEDNLRKLRKLRDLLQESLAG